MARRKRRTYGSSANEHRASAAEAERDLRHHLKEVRRHMSADHCKSALHSLVESGLAAGVVTSERAGAGAPKGSSINTVSKAVRHFSKFCVKG